ncbi:hypothetical protein GCM10011521_08640 [Arenimonas soli]|uniref:Uncharacterized protein n=1 Tax=Arenimonas soli TaxID=2269504 RepID=A0ABQ1HFR6_9GAMM|nr:hypothetical protein [Arenimonas soli]GGA72778.1 hypothetical protein GCM10011521_08640 [Arenimonas soli]
MNSPQDPRKDPLQDDEVALARVLRALPGGEPSPQVDAAILAAARNATAASPAQPHRRRGLPGWALGTAAAAVLAVGIGLQLQPGRNALPDGVNAEAPASASATDAELEQVEVTGSRLKRTETDEAGTVEPQAKPLESPRFVEPPAPAAVVAPPPPPPAAPPAPPRPTAPPAEPGREAEAAAARVLADDVRSREDAASAERERGAARRQEARVAAPVAAPAPTREMAESAGAAPPSAFGADEVLPPVADDSRLAPDAWLERIRDRIRQGDRAGARASLQRFERAHPDITLPPDLAAFRP